MIVSHTICQRNNFLFIWISNISIELRWMCHRTHSVSLRKLKCVSKSVSFAFDFDDCWRHADLWDIQQQQLWMFGLRESNQIAYIQLVLGSGPLQVNRSIYFNRSNLHFITHSTHSCVNNVFAAWTPVASNKFNKIGCAIVGVHDNGRMKTKSLCFIFYSNQNIDIGRALACIRRPISGSINGNILCRFVLL